MLPVVARGAARPAPSHDRRAVSSRWVCQDLLARIAAQRVRGRTWHRRSWSKIVLEPGGSVGTNYVAKADPDGSCILRLGRLAGSSLNGLVYSELTLMMPNAICGPLRFWCGCQILLVVNQRSLLRPFRELIGYIKAQ